MNGFKKDGWGWQSYNFGGVGYLVAWIKKCTVLRTNRAEKLLDMVGPLVALCCYTSAEDGDGQAEVLLKLIGEKLTIWIVLYHWPHGSVAPRLLLLPKPDGNDAPLRGEGGFIFWTQLNVKEQKIKRYLMAPTTCADLKDWLHAKRLNGSCVSVAETVPEGLLEPGGPVEEEDAVSELQGSIASDGAGSKGVEKTLDAEQTTSKAQPNKIDNGEVQIIGDYKVIRTGGREINLAVKYKARSVLRFAHGYLKEKDGVFYVGDLRDAFNGQFGEKMAHKGWYSERLKEDLFRGLKEGDFELLFEVLDQASDLYRLKI